MSRSIPREDDWLNERRDFYDRISSVYDAMSNHYEQASRERGLELLKTSQGERQLELGYGTGRGLEKLARSVGPSGRVIGLEISRGMQGQAAKRLRDSSLLEQVNFLQGDGRALPLRDACLDGIFMSYVLEIFEGERAKQLLGECRRALKPGGRLGVVSLSDAPGETLAVRIYEWLHEKFPHFIDCRPINVKAHLSAAGFSIEAREFGEVWKLPVEIVVGRKP